jgi:CRISPR type III-A-associated protein Csm2
MDKLKAYFDSGNLLAMEKSKDIDTILSTVQDFVKDVEKNEQGISSSQIRNLYSKAQKAETIGELKMLRPKLAYTLARTDKKKTGAKDMIMLIDYCIQKLPLHTKEEEKAEEKNNQNRDGFMNFFEALVAYHRLETELNKKS